MFGSKTRCDSRWAICLCVVVSSLNVAWCYSNSCPESLRNTDAEIPPNIPQDAVEQAFQEAEQLVHTSRHHESKLTHEGRVIPKGSRTAESSHPQANQKPLVARMEWRQKVFDIATYILAERFRLSREQVACGLPAMQLTSPTALKAQQKCISHNPKIVCNNLSKYRTADGTCNNLDHPTWGSAFSPFSRYIPSVYRANGEFRQSVDCGPLPDPRTVSLKIHSSSGGRWAHNVTSLYVFFGQLLDHDMTLTAQSITENNQSLLCCPKSSDNYPQCAPIEIPPDDPFYGKHNKTCLNFVRSAPYPSCTLGSRQQINTVTSYIDCSFMYGNSLSEANSLRTFQGGKLIVQKTPYGDLLAGTDQPHEDHCSVPDSNLTCFRSGDPRVNQHLMLGTMQTLFLREHNRIATGLSEVNPHWDDETLYQETRRIFVAQFQVLAYNEWLRPTVGYQDMIDFDLLQFWDSSYRKDTEASILTEFSTAGMRFGHSLITSLISESPKQPYHIGHLFRDMFFQPYELYHRKIDYFLKGSFEAPAESFDRYLVPDVTNFLYRSQTEHTGLDLAAFNIQRGRDHGLAGFVEYVKAALSIEVKSFDDLVRYHLMSPEDMELLRSVYLNVRDIDLWTAILLGTHDLSAVIGKIGRSIIAYQFQRLKFGDRYFYLHRDNPHPFTTDQLNQIKWVTSLSGMICEHTNITSIQRYPMEYPVDKLNPVVPCIYYPKIDLNLWKENP